MNSTLVKVSELLSDNQYHDGTSIGNQLNITRAAVWKVIKKLEHYGVDLGSVKGKGYLLNTPLILLTEKKIKSFLHNQSIKINLLEKISSTNHYLKDRIDHSKKIRVCIAECQTHGKGRLNRQWHSPFGKNIYLSLLYPFQKDISELSGLSLIVSLAICRAIDAVVDLNGALSIKWPNDVVANKHKIAGSLIEIQAESHGFCQVIIGVGINVNMPDASKKQINQRWSSLLKLTEQHHDRNHLCAEIINYLIEYLERFSATGLKGFIKEWQEKDCLFGLPIEVMSGENKYSGIGAGINNHGQLLLKTENKSLQAFSSGDTTLLK